MAKIVLTDASITVGGVDLSDHIESVTINTEADAPESTAFGDSWRAREGGGLKDWSVDLTWHQDYAASEVDATLWPLLGTSAAFVGKATSDAVSSTNPSYSGNFIVDDYSPINGSVGDLSKLTTGWPGAGALSRATS